jgi:hypothetical protein
MKTPRDILFARHQAAAPKLDAIRQSAVATVYDRRALAEPRSQVTATTIFQTLWQELFLPSRRIWGSLAAVWLLILVINLAQHDSSPAGKMTAAPAMMSFREQQRWMNELFADRVPAADAEPPKTFIPKPRTENYQPLTA